MHSDEVCDLPSKAIVLARTTTTPVQAVEIRHGCGVFGGVQYHPKPTLAEIAAALRRQAADLVDQNLAVDGRSVREHAARIDALDAEPQRRDLAWQLGLDEQVTNSGLRMIEIRNLVEHVGTIRNAMSGAA